MRYVQFGLGILIISLGSAVLAQGKSAATASVARGHATYKQSCAVCHGRYGRGHGPNTSTLPKRAPDLTKIASRPGGFQEAQLEAVITGTDPGHVHTPPAMQAWNAVRLADANGNEAVAAARLNDLIAFIKSIQEK